MNNKEIKEKNNINRLAKMVQDICKKDNGEYDDFSIYKNYVIQLYAFGVRAKCNENFSLDEYNQIIAPRFMEYCLDYRKLNKWEKINETIVDSFVVRNNIKDWGGHNA